VAGDDRDAAGWIADRLSSARADAARIARELADKGHLTAAQVGAIAAAVDTAIARGHELIEDALREPRRALDGLRTRTASGHTDSTGVATGTPTATRIHALETRIAALEDALLHGGHRTRRGSEGD